MLTARRFLSPGCSESRISRLRRGRWNRRGVSDVVATILLLALTVVLFASIFAWVTTFPPAPAQNNNQFQATLRYTSNLTYISGLQILHLAGPSVSGSGSVYLESSTQPTAPEFANPYSISSGLGGAKTWNLGQVWNLTFPLTQMPRAGGNITVYVCLLLPTALQRYPARHDVVAPADDREHIDLPGQPEQGSAVHGVR